MKRAVIIYNLLVISLFLTTGLINATSIRHVGLAFLYLPPLFYFARLLLGNLKNPLTNQNETTEENEQEPGITTLALPANQTIEPLTSDEAIEPEILNDPDIADVNRRLFLKLIGGAGISALVMSMFTDKAHAAFFGSMPVPGAMTLKDSSGNAIDPAEKQPTDGYEISEIDDATAPAYYGFVHKTGAWYISREDENGSYRYAKGTSDFPTSWTDRATLTYDYFDTVF